MPSINETPVDGDFGETDAFDVTSASSSHETNEDDSDLDEPGEPGEPTPTWCIESHELPSEGPRHYVANLDGGLPELWTVVSGIEWDPDRPTSRYVVQRFDGTALSTVDELARPGPFYGFADVDGDGVEDVLVRTGPAGAAGWIRGNPEGSLAEDVRPFDFLLSSHIVLDDVNGDGAIDGLRPVSPGVLDVYIGDGEGGFTVSGSIDTRTEGYRYTGHSLGERHMLLLVEELCLGPCGSSVHAVPVQWTHDGTPSVLARFFVHASPRYIDFADRNGDGLPDLLFERNVGSASRRIVWFDSPTYTESVHIEPSWLWTVADLDLDGTNDLIERATVSDPHTLRFGIATQGFGSTQQLAERPFVGMAARGDLDGDGWLDFVWSNSSEGMLTIWSIIPCRE